MIDDDNNIEAWQRMILYAATIGVGASVCIQHEMITVTAWKGSWINDHKIDMYQVRQADCDIVGIKLMRMIKTVSDAFEEQS